MNKNSKLDRLFNELKSGVLQLCFNAPVKISFWMVGENKVPEESHLQKELIKFITLRYIQFY